MFNGIFSSISDFNILLIMILLCTLFFILPGMYLLFKTHKYNYKSSGTILTSDCIPSNLDEKTKTCNLTVQYPANNRQYTGVDIDEEGNFSAGASIPVYYDNATPRSFIVNHYRIKTVGIVLFTLGVLFICMLVTHYIRYYV
jgi:hypothetical protein